MSKYSMKVLIIVLLAVTVSACSASPEQLAEIDTKAVAKHDYLVENCNLTFVDSMNGRVGRGSNLDWIKVGQKEKCISVLADNKIIDVNETISKYGSRKQHIITVSYKRIGDTSYPDKRMYVYTVNGVITTIQK